MKVKSDFVTNSSSASFIMYFKPKQLYTSLEDFTASLNQYLEYFKKDNGNLHYWNGLTIEPAEKDGVELFRLIEETSMYNGKDDIPEYMQALMVEHFIEEYSYLFTVHSFEIKEDN